MIAPIEDRSEDRLVPAPTWFNCRGCERRVERGELVAPVSEHCAGPILFYICRDCAPGA